VDNRRLILAAVLSMAFVIVWTFLFPPKPTKKPPAGTPRPEARAEAGPPAAAERTPAPSPAAATPGSISSLTKQPPVAASREEQVVLEAGDVRATFTNRGAQLVSLTVAEPGREQRLELVQRRAEGPWPYGLTGKGRGPHPLNRALFRVERGADGRSAVFRYRGSEGEAEKRFAFGPQGLLETQILLPGREGWGVVLGPGLRNLTREQYESRYERRAVVYKVDEVTTLDPRRIAGAQSVPGQGLDWIGVEDNYFLAAAIPRKGLDRVVIDPFLIEEAGEAGARYTPLPAKDDLSDAQKKMQREMRVVLLPEGDRLDLLNYWGPKQYKRLAALPYGLEQTIQLGTFGFLARPLLAGLLWIHNHVVSNYGWAIVLMTFVIRLVLLPLTHTSMRSMKKMQELNPKMQAIRERYRTKLKDKQGRPNLEMQRKMNEEVMGLYKEHGVNPAGGCLPLLLQIPIMFAFYQMLVSAVELRGAPWALWIHDLSAADPYYVLPIVMGATQFLQVKLSPQTGDPMQRRMFLLMPLMMTIFFLGVPSGLVLYWLTSNVLTIVQQGVYNRLRTRSA
jgi:YidC/Oxa1 family membrane protein insertase